MFEYFYSLDWVGKSFAVIAAVATVFLLLQIVIRLMGLGDTDSDVHHGDGSDGDGFHPFTVGNFIAFFAAFGWGGLWALEHGWDTPMAVGTAIVCGLILMLLAALLWWSFSKASGSGTMQIQNAVGQTGNVYLRIAPARGDAGKVMVSVQGSLRELDAVTDDNSWLENGAPVRVIGVVGNGSMVIATKATAARAEGR